MLMKHEFDGSSSGGLLFVCGSSGSGGVASVSLRNAMLVVCCAVVVQ